MILNITGGSFSKNKINSKSIENDERDNETRGGQIAPEIVRVPSQGLGGHQMEQGRASNLLSR